MGRLGVDGVGAGTDCGNRAGLHDFDSGLAGGMVAAIPPQLHDACAVLPQTSPNLLNPCMQSLVVAFVAYICVSSMRFDSHAFPNIS